MKAFQLPNLDLGPELITPQYQGGSLANLADSICHLLNVPPLGIGPLRGDVLSRLGEDVERVVLVLVDALSLELFQAWQSTNVAPVWRKLTSTGLLAPLTSVVPSTTCTALTSLWTGQSASSHGVFGFEMWFKKYSMIANMLFHAPASFYGPHNSHVNGSLELTGFDPQTFIPSPLLGPHLKAHGIDTYVFQRRGILKSGLSQSFLADTKLRGINTSSELWINLRNLLERNANQAFFSYVYWGAVDGLTHYYGPDDERLQAEFSSFSTNFERFFLSKLSSQARRNTAFILTADHGAIHTPQKTNRELKNHPKLLNMLTMLPSGENRCTYLHVQTGQKDNVCAYIHEHWPEDFYLIDSKQALESGLFGPGPHHPDATNRIGDLLAIAKNTAYFWWADKENHLLGRHGGLSDQEMIIPFLAVRLDS